MHTSIEMKRSFSLMLFVCGIFFKYCFSEFYGFDVCQLGLSDVSFDYVVGVRQIRSFPECCGFCTELGTCRSVTFDRVTGTCNLIGQAVSADLMSCLEDSSGQVSYAVKSPACRTSIRYNCDNATICLDDNSECRNGICKCLPGLHHDPNTCSCVSECTEYGQDFQAEIQTYIAGANKKIIRKLTQQECLKACVSESSFVCRSVEYKFPPGVCRLQNTTTYDRNAIFHDNTTLFTRDCALYGDQ